MARAHRPSCDLTVTLDGVEQLTNSSPFDPARRWIYEDPAIDYMVDELRASRRWCRANVTVLLPADVVARPTTEREVRQSIALYCKASLRHLENEIGGLKRQAFGTFWFGFPVLAAAMALIVGIEHIRRLAGVPGTLITEALFIIAWVAAWFPLDMALYSRWPLNLDCKLYRAVMEAPVTIAVDTGASSTARDDDPAAADATVARPA